VAAPEDFNDKKKINIIKNMKRSLLILFAILGMFFIGNSAISIIMSDTSKESFSREPVNTSVVMLQDIKIKLKKPEEVSINNKKVDLGQRLFFDPNLSKDGTVSCATCHKPDHGFADDKPVSLGVNGQKGDRNTPTVFNTSRLKLFFWDGRAMSLEEQALGPVENPVEMGETIKNVLSKLNKNESYTIQFEEVYGKGKITKETLANAIAEFEKTVISKDSDYDRFIAGDVMALSPNAKRGLDLFNGKAMCIACHSGPDFTDGEFHNLRLGDSDIGRGKITGMLEDIGKFKTPTLRDIANTAPYFHNGQIKTLEEAVAFDGIGEKNRDPLDLPVNLTKAEEKDLVEFLKSLSGR
jgi:cytochrome c peroxidase